MTFMINRYQHRETKSPVSQMGIGVKGHIKWQVLNRGGQVVREGDHPNLILDQGLNMVVDRYFSECFTHCCVGTGNSAPNVSNTGLDVEIARTNNYLLGGPDNTGGVVEDPVTMRLRRTFDFPLGALDSSVDGLYKEVGFSYTGTPGANLWSRALFQNGGVPASVDVQADQQLRVIYTVTLQLGPSTVTAGLVNITGLGNTPYTHAIANINESGVDSDSSCDSSPAFASIHSNGVISNVGFSGALDGNGSGWNSQRGGLLEPYLDISSFSNNGYFYASGSDATAALDEPGVPTLTTQPNNFFLISDTRPADLAGFVDTYVPGNFYQDRHIFLDTNTGNFNLSRLHIGNYYQQGSNSTFCYALRFDTPVAKANTHTLDMVFRLSWNRV